MNYAPLPVGNPELGEDSYTKQHLLDFADATWRLRTTPPEFDTRMPPNVLVRLVCAVFGYQWWKL